MGNRFSKRKRYSQHNAMQRYAKERQRNLLAKPGVQDFIVVLDHLKAGYNVPKIFRSAEAFGAREIHLINMEPFDPAPAKGSFRKVPARFHDSFQACHTALSAQGYQFFAMEGRGEQHCYDIALPQKSAFILGHEELGLGLDTLAYADVTSLAIPLPGNMESLNVSVAASIIMYEYNRQHPPGTDT